MAAFSQDSPRNERALLQYRKQIVLSATWALEAYFEIVEAVKLIAASEGTTETWEKDMGTIFRRITEFLTLAAMAAKLVDASSQRTSKIAKSRAEAIRKRWPKIPDPPKELRTMRNHLEHFDERLDRWATHEHALPVVDRSMFTPLSMIPKMRARAGLLRALDPVSMVFAFWDDVVSLVDVSVWLFAVIRAMG